MKHSAPAPGTIVGGKYRVERPLAVGGMAVVVEATHIALGHRVAMKMLTGDAASAPELLMRFRREAQIAAQLPGEHVARVTDVGMTEQGSPYLVMELLVGNDLERELETRQRLPVVEAVDLVLQACIGVAEAHAAGLVHRDLKPGNLFLAKRRDGTRVVKVLDFGISKAAPGSDARLTATQSNFGTPLYMSPEQVQSAKGVDARCDQHALAAILYALLTGQPPYVAESLTAIAVKIATAIPAPLAHTVHDAPPGLEAAILRALEKLPERRFPSVIELAEALAPFGGPDAAKHVSAVRLALTSPRPPAPSNFEILDPPSGQAISAPQLMTSSPTTTSLTGDRKARMPAGFFVGLLSATLLVGAIVAWKLTGSTARDANAIARDATSAATASIAASVAAPIASETPEVTPTPIPTETAAATAVASVAPTATASTSAVPAGAKRGTPSKKGKTSPRNIFDHP